MTTTAATWFYRVPENEPYLLAERVNSSFWEERLGGLYLTTEKSDAPFSMAGSYNGADVKLNWDTNKWLRLETVPASPGLAKGLGNMLHRGANFRYETSEGHTVWEWWLENADKRWQEMQGQPAFRNPARLNSAN